MDSPSASTGSQLASTPVEATNASAETDQASSDALTLPSSVPPDAGQISQPPSSAAISRVGCSNLAELRSRLASVTTAVSSKLLIRTQLRQRFFDLHFGTSGQPFRIFTCETTQLTGDNTKAMQAAMDTLCVAQVATSFHDRDLATTSNIMYNRCMAMLQRMVYKYIQRPLDDLLGDIMGCVHILIPLSWYACVGAGANDWIVHMQSLLKIYETDQWKRLEGLFADFCRYWWKELTMLQHLDLRGKVAPGAKRSLFAVATGDVGTSFYMCLPVSMSDEDSGVTLFQRFASDVANLLRRSDDMLNAPTNYLPGQYEVFDLLTAIGRMVSILKRWQLQCTSATPSRYREVSVHHFRHMRSLAGDHLTTFATVFNFDQAAHERDLRICLICLINLQVATLSIHDSIKRLHPFNKMAELRLQQSAAKFDATNCADALCMLVPWATQPQNRTLGALYAFKGLQLTTKYYLKNDINDRLSWCQEVTKNLTAKYGISIRLHSES